MKKVKFFKMLAAISSLVVVAACGSSNNSSENITGSSSTAANTNAITIDNAGTIPVLSNGTTNSIIYVHNNSNVAISGISYSASLDSKSASSVSTSSLSSPFLDPQSAALCSKIEAFQSCPLKFTTPPLLNHATQGSVFVTLAYQANGTTASFSQVLSYRNAANVLSEGVKFSSGVAVSGFGHSVGYGTVYLYGSGQNNIYTVQDLSSNKAAVSVVNGNINGQQIASNYVQAVEIRSPVAENPIAAELTVASVTGGASSTSVSSAKSVASSSFVSTASVGYGGGIFLDQ